MPGYSILYVPKIQTCFWGHPNPFSMPFTSFGSKFCQEPVFSHFFPVLLGRLFVLHPRLAIKSKFQVWISWELYWFMSFMPSLGDTKNCKWLIMTFVPKKLFKSAFQPRPCHQAFNPTLHFHVITTPESFKFPIGLLEILTSELSIWLWPPLLTRVK